MSKQKYHHGDLRQALIQNGLQLLNKEGYEDFSIRKVAVMCGVSHAAPYKHFADKDQLIAAITKEVADRFQTSLQTVLLRYPDDPQNQIIELGKAYVRFMVENPEYLKFIFLSSFHHKKCIKIDAHGISHDNNPAFLVFYQSALNYLKAVTPQKTDWTADILAMWSLVHGIAVLLANQSIKYEGDYLALVDTMLRNTFHKQP